MSASDPRALPNAELDARLHALQKRAFAIYDAAADATDADSDARMTRAEAEVAPLLVEAKLLSDERVRRLRARARLWRITAVVIAVVGGIAVLWLIRRV